MICTQQHNNVYDACDWFDRPTLPAKGILKGSVQKISLRASATKLAFTAMVNSMGSSAAGKTGNKGWHDKGCLTLLCQHLQTMQEDFEYDKHRIEKNYIYT